MLNNFTTDTFANSIERLFELAKDNIPAAELEALTSLRNAVGNLKGLECNIIPTFSTAHLSGYELLQLDKGELKMPGVVHSMRSDYGPLLWVDPEADSADEETSMLLPGLSCVVNFARTNGIAYIRFDGGGEIAEQLPVYEH